jgi:hypothetical protein
MDGILYGMNKSEVMNTLGEPTRSIVEGKKEYLIYNLTANYWEYINNMRRPYYVLLVDGKVEDFGKLTDEIPVKYTPFVIAPATR